MTTTFLSYAQNNEDVLLWRALGHIKDGFYIDVGANDPVEHSVTKAFYDAGWRGISIEPLPAFHQAFQDQRPRDVNLAIAAGSSDGSLTLYDVADVNGWASPERAVAEGHRAAGHEVRELVVPVRTLASVCSEYVQGEIHFLKIDVEGFEAEVLRGMDFGRWRPWVLVVEATLPGQRETNHETWEHLVVGQRYRYAWFDGLNRYYVAEEHAELLQHFGVQPNVFDSFISHHLDKAWSANREAMRALRETEQHADDVRAELQRTGQQAAAVRDELQRTEQQAAAVRAELHRTEQHAAAVRGELHNALRHAEAVELEKHLVLDQVAQLQQDLARLQQDLARQHQELAAAHADGHHLTLWARDLEQRLTATLNSTSWKVTRPLRMAGSLWISLRRPGLLRRLLLRTTRSQRLRRMLVPVLLRHPPLARRVSATLQAARQAAPLAPAPGTPGIEVPAELRALPASVRSVLGDLQRARELNQ
jgi:FkbM family methyltransferase